MLRSQVIRYEGARDRSLQGDYARFFHAGHQQGAELILNPRDGFRFSFARGIDLKSARDAGIKIFSGFARKFFDGTRGNAHARRRELASYARRHEIVSARAFGLTARCYDRIRAQERTARAELILNPRARGDNEKFLRIQKVRSGEEIEIRLRSSGNFYHKTKGVLWEIQ